MKEGLVALLERKTAGSRRDAQREIENWRKSLDLVAEAERKAECKINLPSALIEPVNRAAMEAKVADHVSALGLASIASKQNQEVIPVAKRLLQEVLQARKNAVYMAQEDIKKSTKVRDATVHNTTNILVQAKEQIMQPFKNINIFREEELNGYSFELRLFLFILWLVLSILWWVVPVLRNIVLLTVVLLPLIIAIFSVGIATVVSYKKWVLYKQIKAKALQEEAQAEEEFRQQLPALEAALALAQGKLKKLQDALLPLGGEVSEDIFWEMVSIPGGTFDMGGDKGNNEQPIHRVELDGFSMSKNVVTVGQYEAYCKATGTKMPDTFDFNAGWVRKDHPIVNVSWKDANGYCTWLSEKTGKTYDLPTEAEWEYAARGGLAGKAYPWGDEFDLSKLRCSDKAFRDSGGTARVGSYPANGYGLYDMAGNVWQWCSDWYDEDYYANSPSRNPQGSDSGTVCVLRGGSWNFIYPEYFRCAARHRRDPGSGGADGGFRVVFRGLR